MGAGCLFYWPYFRQRQKGCPEVQQGDKVLPPKLSPRLYSAQGQGPLHCLGKVFHLEVKVHLFLLLPLFFRPDGAGIPFQLLEQKHHAAASHCGMSIEFAPLPPQQRGIEFPQALLVAAVHHDIPQNNFCRHIRPPLQRNCFRLDGAATLGKLSYLDLILQIVFTLRTV